MPHSSQGPPLRVLIADDCADTTTTLAQLLRLWGHDCRIAADGLAALELAAIYRPDVVLLDISMPRLNGFDLARRLRHELLLDDALLVSISGYGRDSDHRDSLDAGCDVHLVKPVEPEALQNLLASAGQTGRVLRPDRQWVRFAAGVN